MIFSHVLIVNKLPSFPPNKGAVSRYAQATHQIQRWYKRSGNRLAVCTACTGYTPDTRGAEIGYTPDTRGAAIGYTPDTRGAAIGYTTDQFLCPFGFGAYSRLYQSDGPDTRGDSKTDQIPEAKVRRTSTFRVFVFFLAANHNT